MTSVDEYVRIASRGDLTPGGALIANVGRYDVALFNVGGDFYAYENVCPHQGGPIGEGFVEDATVTCPWHAWCFDLRSGFMTIGEFARLTRFAVRVDGDDVLVSTAPLPEES